MERTQPLGLVIEAERFRRGMKTKAFAVACGLTRMQLYRIETGECHPPIPTLRRIAQALGVTAGWLLDQSL